MENFSTILQTVWRPAQKNSWGVASTPPPDRARVKELDTFNHQENFKPICQYLAPKAKFSSKTLR